MEKKSWELYFDAVKKQDWAAAKEVLKKIAREEKYNPQVYLKMGDVCQRAGDAANAIASYHVSARILKSQGFNQKAIALYKIILRLDPANEEAIGRSRELMQEMEASRGAHHRPASLAADQPGSEMAFERTASMAMEEPALSEMVFERTAPEAPEEFVSSEVSGVESREETPMIQEQTFEVSSERPFVVDETSAGETPQFLQVEGLGGSVISEIFSDMTEDEFNKALDELVVPFSERPETSRVPELFYGMSEEEYKGVLDGLEVRSFSGKAKVIEEGDSGDSMYIIKSGNAKVIAHLMGKAVELADLGEGDVFGEVAFLTGRMRTADVVAVGPLKVYEITRLEIERIIEKNPAILARLEDFYETRVKSTVRKITPR